MSLALVSVALATNQHHCPTTVALTAAQRASCVRTGASSAASLHAPRLRCSCDSHTHSTLFAHRSYFILDVGVPLVFCTRRCVFHRLHVFKGMLRFLRCIIQYQWLSPLYLCTLSHLLCLRSWFLHCLGTPRTQALNFAFCIFLNIYMYMYMYVIDVVGEQS